jgi:hypothetical protein
VVAIVGGSVWSDWRHITAQSIGLWERYLIQDFEGLPRKPMSTVSIDPNPGHSESVLLAMIVQLLQSSTSGGGSGHFDSSGNPRIYDSANNGYYTLTAPNGILTLTNFSGGGGGGSGHFDSSGNPRIYDSANNGYYTLTAPNGILTSTNFSTSP